jgi:hypothetical protein
LVWGLLCAVPIPILKTSHRPTVREHERQSRQSASAQANP